MLLHKDFTEYVVVFCQLSVCCQHVSFNKQGPEKHHTITTIKTGAPDSLHCGHLGAPDSLHCGHHGAPDSLHRGHLGAPYGLHWSP